MKLAESRSEARNESRNSNGEHQKLLFCCHQGELKTNLLNGNVYARLEIN